MITWEALQKIGVTSVREEITESWSPCGKEIFFEGGTDEDIAEFIYQNIPLADYIFMSGNTEVILKKSCGDFTAKFSREI